MNIEIECHVINKRIQVKVVTIKHMTNLNQVADIFTKNTSSTQFHTVPSDRNS